MYLLGTLTVKMKSPEFYNFTHPGMFKVQEQVLHNRYAFVRFAEWQQNRLYLPRIIHVETYVYVKCNWHNV